jgi:hypothetical protein
MFRIIGHRHFAQRIQPTHPAIFMTAIRIDAVYPVSQQARVPARRSAGGKSKKQSLI